MPRFEFAVGNPSTFRKAGIVQSESFDDALEAITEQVTVRDGDTLEIGVRGFPPAHYQCVWPKINGVPSWRPTGLRAA
jgi:hypothetical protein